MFSRENITLGVILFCVIATVYLFKEMKEVKVALERPPQILKVPYPVPVQQEEEEEEEEEDEEQEQEQEEENEEIKED